MIRSLLLSSVAGARSMTPLAVAALAQRAHRLPPGRGVLSLLGSAPVVAGLSALALGELAGDKLKSAPDRTVPIGMAARTLTGAVSAAALAPRGERAGAGLLGGAVAIAASYLTLNLRKRALRRFGQTRSGLVEDALAVASALLIARGAGRQGWRRVA